MNARTAIFCTFAGLAMAVALPACLADPTDRYRSPDPTAQTPEAIVGGTTKRTGHWEIGKYQNSVGGTCTGTLIADQWFIMAAHCIGYQAFANAQQIGTGATFTSGDPSQGPARVDYIWSYNGNPSKYTAAGCNIDNKTAPDCSNGVGWYDIALGHLATPINNTGSFDMRPIALVGPVPGDQVTDYGYGCNNRSTLTGPSVLQKITYTFGPSSFLCPGDSGGPLLRSDGTLAYVNSGFDGSGNDVFGDLTYFKSRVWQQIRQIDFQESHVLRTGFDNYNLSADLPGCANLCRETTACHSYTFDPSANQCWGEFALPEPQFYNTNSPLYSIVEGSYLGTFLSAPEASLVPDFGTFGDRPGGDLPNMPIHLNNNLPIECSWKCDQDPNCKAWTLVLTTGSCWLKRKVPALTNTSTCTGLACLSGVRRTAELADRPGYDLQGGVSATWEQCKTLCSQRGDCLAISWDPNSSTCYEKYRTGAPVVQSYQIFSALRGGMLYNVNYVGNDIMGAGFDYPSSAAPIPETCQAACANDSRCNAWTFAQVNTGTTTPNVPHCSLKTDFGTLQGSMRGMVSGGKAAFEDGQP